MTPEAVRITEGVLSSKRPARDWAENPAKTTECTAPILAHANCRQDAGLSMALSCRLAVRGKHLLRARQHSISFTADTHVQPAYQRHDANGKPGAHILHA